jgi:RND family efflux transporter MFP subunit
VKTTQIFTKKWFWPAVLALVLVIAGGLAFGFRNNQQATPAKAQQTTYQTTSVQRGDLAMTATGTGTLEPGSTVDLSFSASGTVGQLNVQVGDQVTTGQSLAALSEISELELKLQTAQIELNTAKKELDTLLSGADEQLAQAYSDYADAQTALADAQKNLHNKGDGRCSQEKTQSYYFDTLYAQKNVNTWQDYLTFGTSGYGRDYILQRLETLKKDFETVTENYNYCQGYTTEEIETSQANYQVAEANLKLAESKYQKLQANSGLDPKAVEIAQVKVQNAELQVTKAQKVLEGATLTATIDGTVITVKGSVGDKVGTSTFLTIADMKNPTVLVNIDEADLLSFNVGCSAEVTFDAYPNKKFEGVVTEVNPVLVEVRSVDVVEGTVGLQGAAAVPGKTLPSGINGTVDVTCEQAKGALLIPITALHQDTTDLTNFVYVLNSQGEPEKRSIEVGLRGATSVEVTTGLSEGEQVITSAVNLK